MKDYYCKTIDNNDDSFSKAKIYTIKDMAELIDRISNHEDENVGRLIRSLLHKGLAYDQTAWERDVAISQLEKIGLKFGENPDHIIEIIEHARMVEDDLK